jgi:hypothetical protein
MNDQKKQEEEQQKKMNSVQKGGDDEWVHETVQGPNGESLKLSSLRDPKTAERIIEEMINTVPIPE